MGATTPSPYKYNKTRYSKVPSRVKQNGDKGGLCAILALMMIAIPITALTAVGELVVQNI